METHSDEAGRRLGARIYRAADAPEMYQTDFGSGSDFTEHPELAEIGTALGKAGGVQTRLLVRQTLEEGGFSLLHLWFKPHFPLFRHRHEVDCMYILLSGSAVMGNQTLRAGDSFFVAAQAPYFWTAGSDGVELLEIRHGVESFTTIFAKNSAARIAEAEDALRENAERWQEMSISPLFSANRATD